MAVLSFPLVLILSLIASFVTAAPLELKPRALSGYAPTKVTCPTTALVRPATGLSTEESNYIAARSTKASQALAAWLEKTNSGFGTQTLPRLALANSGGGYRALLEGAGVIQAFDSRDSNTSVSGLLQALTYHTGLSGGAWLLSSFAGNNYPTITSLKNSLWKEAFAVSLLVPENLLVAEAYTEIVNDIVAKGAAGFPPTLTDPWGRLLSYQLLNGADGGVSDTLSGITAVSNFTSYNVPYPILTSLGVKTFEGQCEPGPNATTYELTPYEFGSWDEGVNAFTPTAYLGTSLNNGKPSNTTCVMNYDNLGYALGTSSTLFNDACEIIPASNATGTSFEALAEDLEEIVSNTHIPTSRDLYAVYPNPFYNYNRSTLVSAQTELDIVDGGEASQNNPIFPLLQPSRAVDVMIISDNSADTTNNWPNGSEILTTYVQATNNAGLTRMPVIPSVQTFLSEGLNQRPTFFGCNDTSKITTIYLPNYDYTYPSNQSTLRLQYAPSDTDGMIANGVQIASKGGDTEWATCMGCAIMKKTGSTLPAQCTACFTKYCYN